MDMLIGVNAGIGYARQTFNYYTLSNVGANYMNMTLGPTFEVYIFDWLSANSGVLVRGDFGYASGKFGETNSTKHMIDIYPQSVVLPIAGHVNLPFMPWLYAGAGISFNFPLFNVAGSREPSDFSRNLWLYSYSAEDFKKLEKVFISIPIDIGIDMMKDNQKNGSRLFLRIAPEFHKKDVLWKVTVLVPVGLMYQYNFRVYRQTAAPVRTTAVQTQPGTASAQTQPVSARSDPTAGMTGRTISSIGTINAIAFGNGRFVASGINGTAYSDDGVIWTIVSSRALDFIGRVHTITHSGNSFTAIGPNGTAHSGDGATWTAIIQ
jgi:hypothetical protein